MWLIISKMSDSLVKTCFPVKYICEKSFREAEPVQMCKNMYNINVKRRQHILDSTLIYIQ